MKTITASVHYEITPPWAVLERKLIDTMDEAVHPYIEKYTRADGSLVWADTWSGSRDGMDDFYEAFTNFAQFYSLGVGDHLLEAADRHWDAITRQLTGFGRIHREYERGYDQFHQCESYIYFYHLCLADPGNPKLRARARRFAGFYLNESPNAPNYDPVHRIIRAPHNGSGGPAWGMSEDDSQMTYNPGLRRHACSRRTPPATMSALSRLSASYEEAVNPLRKRLGLLCDCSRGEITCVRHSISMY